MLHATQLTSKTLDTEACELPWLAATRMGHRMPLSELSIVHKTGHHELSLLSSEPLPCVLTLAHCHRCFPGDSDAEESALNAGDPSSIPESGISPGEGKGYSHEIKRHVLLGRKVMINLVSILKSRDIALSTKVGLVRLWFFQWSCMDVRVGP